MEPAWEKVNGSNFRLVEYQDKKGELRPCYQLTKTECLYIATKFNDEARAKLVIRWEELERAHVGTGTPCDIAVRHHMGASPQCALPQCALLPAKEVLAMADEIIGEGLRLVNEPAEDTLTATQVAKTFNMTVFDFNAVLRDMGIQFTFEQAIQHSVAVKGANVNHNTVRMMLKNWRKQGLVFLTDDGRYRKIEELVKVVKVIWSFSIFVWEVCHLCEQEGWNELPLPSLYPRKHRELLRAIVAVKTGISFYKINLKALDAAYSIAFPNSTPINVNKKKRV